MTHIFIYYPELVENSFWGKDEVMIKNDINLLEKTDFNLKGYEIVSLSPDSETLKNFITKNISNIIGIPSQTIQIDKYHLYVNEEQHKQVLNSMPYKKNDSHELRVFSEYIEKILSDLLKEKVKIFNDDIWVRICRPNTYSKEDFNPCHRDVYLDFYRNTVNIYLPLVGSNEKSSLLVQEGSHLWNENITAITNGGAFFNNKKYSVDAITQSKIELNMVRPNPSLNQVLVFSPYLIHGCSDNNNDHVTRMSLEIRFIKDDKNSINQEDAIKNFINTRIWR